MPENSKQITNEIGSATNLARLDGAFKVDSVISSGIYKLTTTKDEADAKDKNTNVGSVANDWLAEDHAEVRVILKHLVKDWNEEGRGERYRTFGWSSMD